MVDFIAIRVAYRDRLAALAGDTRCVGTGFTSSGIADTRKRAHLGTALPPTGMS